MFYYVCSTYYPNPNLVSCIKSVALAYMLISYSNSDYSIDLPCSGVKSKLKRKKQKEKEKENNTKQKRVLYTADPYPTIQQYLKTNCIVVNHTTTVTNPLVP